jgi:DNA-binding NtrC family response regulator
VVFIVVVANTQAIGGPLPRDRQVTTGNSPQLAKKSALARILVVDDEPLMRWSVAETLAGRGYQISEADDAASAIRACSTASCSFDVVFLDLRLPDCDDLRVLSAMRRLLPHTPVILMTAYDSPELVIEARRLGVFAIIDKPFEMDALQPLVERAQIARPAGSSGRVSRLFS